MHMRYSNPAETNRDDLRSQEAGGRQRHDHVHHDMAFVLIPLVGLAIDGTMMYSVKVKLQTAVDGAALAAAQSLSAGPTSPCKQRRRPWRRTNS